MSATIVKQPSANPSNKTATTKARATAPAKGRRIFRRRGRARGELDSDDELEREAATDSDTDNNDLSSTDSATDDSDTEPASDDVVPHDRTHLPTPRNSKSPDSVIKEPTRQMNGESASFFAASTNWSDNVEREEVEGANLVPVIDFADFDAKAAERIPTASKSKKAKQKAKRAAKHQAGTDVASQQLAQPSLHQNQASPPKDEPAPLDHKQSAWSAVQESSPSSYVSPARQAYQQRLETDPSYVPKIGNFWGHDDRLIDADLRSLSFWWNSQRGRGRGRGGFRGRGGHHAGDNFHKLPEDQEQEQQVEQIPAIERTWTHDGFEELKRKEEQRRTQAAARQDSASKRGGFAGPRGAFAGSRGRGGFMHGSLLSPGGRNSLPQNRIRFVMKPEVMWTKQSEFYLFLDPAMKPRHGQGSGFRIRIPGHEGEVVRAPLASSKPQELPPKASRPATSNFTVRLPCPKADANVELTTEDPVEESIQRDEEEDPVNLEARPTSITPHQVATPLHPEIQPSLVVSALPLPSIRTQLEQITLEPAEPSPERQALTEQAVLRKPSVDLGTPATEVTNTERPTLPPLQTTFTPPPPPPQPQPIQPNPGYGAPYGYSAPLPHGIGMNPHGMPYELATGRPVYLPHPPMYNPRPMIHSHNSSMSFLPGHMRHPSNGTPDFIAQPPHTPPVNGFIDHSTGNPIFSFPRPNARIEIRPPGEEGSKQTPPKSSTAPRASTNLRTVAPPFQPSMYSTDQRQPNGYYTPSDGSLPTYDNSNGHNMPMDDVNQGMASGMMPYPSYQQPYYYPEPYGYSHQYLDMSQHGQYDMYNMDQVPQGTVYY